MTSDKIFSEDDPASDDFTGTICRQWEEAVDQFNDCGIRTVKIRTAVVLAKNDSALSKLKLPAKFGFLIRIGNGRQYMPWIHITDLCNIYLKAIEDNEMRGAYNAVSPQHVTNKDFIKILAHVMRRPVFPLPVPSVVLRAALGEMSDMILKGSRVSSQKISEKGYCFVSGNLEEALIDLIKE